MIENYKPLFVYLFHNNIEDSKGTYNMLELCIKNNINFNLISNSKIYNINSEEIKEMFNIKLKKRKLSFNTNYNKNDLNNFFKKKKYN